MLQHLLFWVTSVLDYFSTLDEPILVVLQQKQLNWVHENRHLQRYLGHCFRIYDFERDSDNRKRFSQTFLTSISIKALRAPNCLKSNRKCKRIILGFVTTSSNGMKVNSRASVLQCVCRMEPCGGMYTKQWTQKQTSGFGSKAAEKSAFSAPAQLAGE